MCVHVDVLSRGEYCALKQVDDNGWCCRCQQMLEHLIFETFAHDLRVVLTLISAAADNSYTSSHMLRVCPENVSHVSPSEPPPTRWHRGRRSCCSRGGVRSSTGGPCDGSSIKLRPRRQPADCKRQSDCVTVRPLKQGLRQIRFHAAVATLMMHHAI